MEGPHFSTLKLNLSVFSDLEFTLKYVLLDKYKQHNDMLFNSGINVEQDTC